MDSLAREMPGAAQLSMSPAGPEWNDISQEARTCIRRMLVLEPSKRITAAGLLDMPWLKNSSALSDKVWGHLAAAEGHCGWTTVDLHEAGETCHHLTFSPPPSAVRRLQVLRLQH